MPSVMTRIRALFGSRANGERRRSEVHDELRAYEQHYRTLLVGRGVICWWSGRPVSDRASRKPNGRPD